MIYAPPSREKTKQTMRSPLLEKGKVGVTMPADEYAIAASNTLYQGQMGGRKKGSQTHQNANFAASSHGGNFRGGQGHRMWVGSQALNMYFDKQRMLIWIDREQQAN